jgi:Trypsin-like serine proteases, typically periplasmic, contain C-terminal PDZ domain
MASAAKAGVEMGDVIRSVNGSEINSSSDLPPLIGALPPGSRVKLGILRDGKQREITVTLTELAEDAQRSASPSPDGAPARPETGANALLGLEVAELTAAERRQAGLGAGEGVRITRVNSAAAREARLAPGMVILQVGRNPVGTVAELNRQLGTYRKGDVVMLLVRSGSSNAFVTVKLGD